MSQYELTTEAVEALGALARAGRPGFYESYVELAATYDEISAEAGRYGHLCDFTRETLGMVNDALRTLYRQAVAEASLLSVDA